ncbi:MAG: hypothetical protein JWR80_7229 [Bradyrhizobium sp.]|nr:hypothetical protein [Bradyrhizobium sp.]
MRAIVLASIAVQIGLALPAFGQGSPDTARCGRLGNLADQLFCSDPELNAISPKLARAIQDRLNRLPNTKQAIDENAEWIRNRNSSCGIFANQNISNQNIPAIKSCLLRVTEERIPMLQDPNFDCLATNNAAGLVICSDPELAIAKTELNEHVLGLIAKLKGDDAKAAYTEYARWSRERDRKCGLVNKDNVPLAELESSEPCLAEYMRLRIAEIVAAKGDAKRIFGRNPFSPALNADAVDLCVAQIHSANACDDFLAVNEVFETSQEVTLQTALVTAEVEMKVLSPFTACSAIASSCTGTCWDMKSGQAKAAAAGSKENLTSVHRVRIEKSFAFQKTPSGGWRCSTTTLQPVERGFAVSDP